jgi:hypothetical protein
MAVRGVRVTAMPVSGRDPATGLSSGVLGLTFPADEQRGPDGQGVRVAPGPTMTGRDRS